MITAQQISNYVDSHQHEALEFLQEIIQTPSVTGDEEAVSFIFDVISVFALHSLSYYAS